MTEVEIEVETPQATETPQEAREELAEAIVEAQEEAQEEAEQEAAVEQAVETSESALQAVSEHEHFGYASVDHSHDTEALSAQISAIEGRLGSLEQQFEESSEEVVEVEEIEPTPEPTPEPEKRRAGFRRGRR